MHDGDVLLMGQQLFRVKFLSRSISQVSPWRPYAPIRVVAAVIANEGRYLITQRRPTAVLPLLWEFPGGRVEAGETDADALKREVFASPRRADRRGRAHLVREPPVRALRRRSLPLRVPRSLGRASSRTTCSDFRWVTSDEFDQYPFTPADEASMNKLLGLP